MNIQRYEQTLHESNIQKEKHLPTGKPNDKQDERNILYSIHQRGKRKTLWYQTSWETMEATSVPTNKEHVTYKSKIYPYHALHHSILTTVLPEVKVKAGETVRIKWCDDIFINMVKEYRLFFNDTELQYGNNKLLLSIANQLDINYTNCKWSQHLKTTPVSMRAPFAYGEGHVSDAFPLSLCGQNDRLHHVFDFNLMLENLLLMQDDKGNLIDLDMSKLEVGNNVDCVPIPELEGKYTTHTSKECDLSNCKENEVDGVREYFVRNAYYIEDDNEVPLGKRIQIKFDSKTNYPVEDIVWGAINVTESNRLKNLIVTSNHETPIKSTKLETSISTLLDNKDSFKTEYAYHSDMREYIPGISFWMNDAIEPDGRSHRPGVNFAGGKITINTKNDNTNSKFMAFVIMFHTRRFVFKTYPKTQEERLVKGATIELVNE